MNMEYIGDHQESLNIHCIQRNESVTLELLHLAKSLVYSKIFLKTIFQLVANYVLHIKETKKMMKESKNNDNSVVSEYTEIIEAKALSQKEIESADILTHHM